MRRVPLHWPTLGAAIGVYFALLAIIFAVPHEPDPTRFGRMNAHQGFATLGETLSLGTRRLTMVHWYYDYYAGAESWEDAVQKHDRIVWRTAARVAPWWCGWAVAVAVAVGAWRRLKRRDRPTGA